MATTLFKVSVASALFALSANALEIVDYVHTEYQGNALANDGDALYIAYQSEPAIIAVVDPDTLEELDFFEASGSADDALTIYVDKNSAFAYFSTNTAPSTFVKVDLEDLTSGTTGFKLTGATGMNNVFSGYITQKHATAADEKIYYVSSGATTVIESVKTADMTTVANLDLTAGTAAIKNVEAQIIADTLEENLFLACKTDPAVIVKLLPALPDTAPAILTFAAGKGSKPYFQLGDGVNGYVFTDDEPGMIVKYVMATMADPIAADIFEGGEGEDKFEAGAIDGDYLYIGTFADPAYVIKIDTGDMSRQDTLDATAVSDEMWNFFYGVSGSDSDFYFLIWDEETDAVPMLVHLADECDNQIETDAVPLDCNGRGLGISGEAAACVCNCKYSFAGDSCDECDATLGFEKDASVTTGLACKCMLNFAGDDCMQCATKYEEWPTCSEIACNFTNTECVEANTASFNGTLVSGCDCNCKEGFEGTNCDTAVVESSSSEPETKAPVGSSLSTASPLSVGLATAACAVLALFAA